MSPQTTIVVVVESLEYFACLVSQSFSPVHNSFLDLRSQAPPQQTHRKVCLSFHNGCRVEKLSCSSPQKSSSPRGWCLHPSSCSRQTHWSYFWTSPPPHLVHQQFLLVLLSNIFVIQPTAPTLAQVMVVIYPLEY